MTLTITAYFDLNFKSWVRNSEFKHFRYHHSLMPFLLHLRLQRKLEDLCPAFNFTFSSGRRAEALWTFLERRSSACYFAPGKERKWEVCLDGNCEINLWFMLLSYTLMEMFTGR